jgi:DNA-binding CsgD family transcriptional regulator
MAKSKRTLTARELDVLRLLCRGLSAREIATALGISPYTVAAHRANIKKATGTRKTAQLVVHALEQGLVRIRAD